MKKNNTSKLLLIARIALLFSFFTPFITVGCFHKQESSSTQVDSTAVDTAVVIVDTTYNEESITENDTAAVLQLSKEDSIKEARIQDSMIQLSDSIARVDSLEQIDEKNNPLYKIWGFMITGGGEAALSGFTYAYATTIDFNTLLKAKGTEFITLLFITLAFYLSILMIIFNFTRKKRTKRDLVISVIISVLIFVPLIIHVVDADIRWGFYVCLLVCFLNLILQIRLLKKNKNV